MFHESVIQLLPEMVEGRLAPGPVAELEAHLAECDECRQYHRTCRLIALASRADAAGSHPAAEDLVAYAAGAVPAARRAEIDTHLAGCHACDEDVRATRASRADVRAAIRGAGPSTGRVARIAAIAAGLLIAVLAWPAWIGVRTIATTEAPWAGTATLTVLSSELRGDGEGTVVTIANGQPHVLLGVDLATGAADAARLDVAIVAADGAVRFSRTLTGAQARAQSGAAGVVVLVVPAADLGPGSYVFSVRRDGQPVFESRFETRAAE